MAFGFFNADDPTDTPESTKRKRAVAEALMQGIAGRPAQNIGEGLAAIGNALLARSLMKQATDADAANADFSKSEREKLFGGMPNTFTTDAPGAGSTVGSAPTADLSGNQIYSGFMGTLKDGGLTNPNGLAAVASTVQHESGFSPGNVYRAWNDPSESGQAGTSGGLMSLRNERFANMRNFVADNGGDPSKPSPELQARYFLQENPQLTASLQAARSPEEAQQLMNRAWAFKGWDKPGGEAAARISTARSFASQFGGPQANADDGRRPVQVASLDPSEAMANVALGPDTTNISPDKTAQLVAALNGKGDRLQPVVAPLSDAAFSARADATPAPTDAQKRQMVANALMSPPSPPVLQPLAPTQTLVGKDVTPTGNAAVAAALTGKGDRVLPAVAPSAIPLSDAAAAARMGGSAPAAPPALSTIAPLPVVSVASAQPYLASPTLKGQGQAAPVSPQFASLPDQGPMPADRPEPPTPQFAALPQQVPVLGNRPDVDGTTTASLPTITRSDGYPPIDHSAHGKSAIDRALAIADAHVARMQPALAPINQQGGFDHGGSANLATVQGGLPARGAVPTPAARRGNLLGLLGFGSAPQLTSGAPNRSVDGQPPAQGGQFSSAGAPASSASGTPSTADLMEAYGDPRLDESTRGMIGLVLKQRMADADPLHQLQLRRAQVELDKEGRPKYGFTKGADGSLIRYDQDGNYQTIQDGKAAFHTLTPDEVKAAGLPPGSYQVGPDGKVAQIGGKGITINAGDYKMPAGFMPVDPNDPSAGVKPIPGGPATQLPSELAGRIGLADNFLKQLPDIQTKVKAGGATGAVNRTLGQWDDSSDAAGLIRKMKSGTDALQRMLTGAGMNETEAAEYAGRYLPSFTDTASSASSKLDQLEAELRSMRTAAMQGHGGNDTAPSVTPDTNDPLGLR